MIYQWKDLGFKDRAQYISALVLIASGIVIAFASFFMTYTIANGVLIYISQAFITAGGIFGVSIYFKSKLGEFESKADNKIADIITEVINKVSNENIAKENSKEE